MSVRRATTRRPKPKFEKGDKLLLKVEVLKVDKKYNPPVFKVGLRGSWIHVFGEDLIREKK